MSQRQKRARLDRRRRAAARARAVGIGGGALAAALVPATTAGAATSTDFTVSTLSDSGPGSLRRAIIDANTAGGNDTILFRSGLSGDIDLKSALPTVTTNLDIQGPGARVLTLDASAVTGPTPELSVEALQATHHTLTISGLSMDNSASSAFLYTQPFGSVSLYADTFANDRGGAVYANFYGTATIEGSTFAGDGSPAINAPRETLYMSDSTVTGNGIGVHLDTGNATITGSTITDSSGAAITDYNYHGNSRHFTLQDSIVVGTASSDVALSGADLTFAATFSLIRHATGLSGLDSTDITGKDPKLGALRDNGGPTNTELPQPSSPVIDQGNAFGFITDQRGLQRPLRYPGKISPSGGDGSDIGAVELQLPPAITHVAPATASAGQAVTITGSWFTNATEVLFGSTRAVFDVLDFHHIRAAVPPGSGTVNLRVITPDGQSAIRLADRFSYLK